MQYLVQMELVNANRPASVPEGVGLIEQLILPTLARCKKLEAEGKIVGGGPVSGAIALSLVVDAESSQEVDEVVTSLPAWARMETTVTPLTTFDERVQLVQTQLQRLKSQIPNGGK